MEALLRKRISAAKSVRIRDIYFEKRRAKLRTSGAIRSSEIPRRSQIGEFLAEAVLQLHPGHFDVLGVLPQPHPVVDCHY